MKSFMEIVQGRRSVRKYEEKSVPEETLNRVLESVRWSPSWSNTQCWEIINVRDPELRKQVQACLPPKGNPAYKAIVSAPVLLVLCGKLKRSGCYQEMETTKFGDWMLFDLGIAAQTLCLTAWHYGLGTVIVGLFDHDKAASALNVRKGYDVVALIPMGYPAKISKAPARKALADFVHDDVFR